MSEPMTEEGMNAIDDDVQVMIANPAFIRYYVVRKHELERENAALTAEVSRLTENQRLQDSATAAVLERNEKLTARVAELERDAGRYRWLRDQNWTQRGLFVVSANNQDVVRLGTNCPSSELLDAAIDAVRAKMEEQK